MSGSTAPPARGTVPTAPRTVSAPLAAATAGDRPRSAAGDDAGVNRGLILQATITLIDRDGLRLTARKISDQLGVEPGALSRFFPNRDALLDAVVETVIDELFADPEVQPATSDWQEYLQRVAHGVRRIAIAHPQLFPLIATRPSAAPWLQPPLRSLRWMEAFLETLHRCGFSDRSAVAVYRAFSSFLLGHLLLEVSTLGAELSPVPDPRSRRPPPSDLDNYPRLRSMQPALTQNHAEDEFEEALESLLDRLEHDGLR